MTENGQIEWLPKQISFALNKVRGNLETFKELVPPVTTCQGLSNHFYRLFDVFLSPFP